MGLIFLHDKACAAAIPHADLSVAVDAADDLEKIIKQLAFTMDRTLSTAVPGYYNELHIACNCNATGLMIGSGMNDGNAALLFKPLKFKVGNIVIHNTAAAVIYKDGNNGVQLCKALARSVFANVTASALLQGTDACKPAIKSSLKRVKNFVETATWNCKGHISLLNIFDENGKVIYSINYPGDDALNLVEKPQKRVAAEGLGLHRSAPFRLLKKISNIYYQLSHYLQAHAA